MKRPKPIKTDTSTHPTAPLTSVTKPANKLPLQQTNTSSPLQPDSATALRSEVPQVIPSRGFTSSIGSRPNASPDRQKGPRKIVNRTQIATGSKAGKGEGGDRNQIGLIIGKGNAFVSLKTQQDLIEMELAKGQSGGQISEQAKQDQARDILHQRLAQNITTTNSTSVTKKITNSQKKNLDPLQAKQLQTTQEMNSLDRTQRIPKDQYSLSGALSIEDSPYKNLYLKVSTEIMGESNNQAAPYLYNKRLYQKHARKDEPKEAHQFERMRPSTDLEVQLATQPKLFNITSDPGQSASEIFYTRDFPDRNMSLKQSKIKQIASEESLDDWYAQSLGIPYDKLLKQKRLLNNIMSESRKKKSAPAQNQRDSRLNQNRFRQKNPRRQNIKSAFESRFVKKGLPFSSKQMANTQQVGNMQQFKEQEKKQSQMLNKMLENERQKRAVQSVKSPQELKPFVFPRHSKEPSHVIKMNQKEVKTAKSNDGFMKPIQKQTKSPPNLQKSKSFEEQAEEALKCNMWPKYWTKDGMQKSQLLREIGGFQQKEYLWNFYKGMLARKDEMKNGPKTLQGPDEEFLQKQKKKLRDLMFRNSEIEIRKQLKMQEHYAKLRAAKEAYKPKPKYSPTHNENPDGTITFNEDRNESKNQQLRNFMSNQAREYRIDIQDQEEGLVEPFQGSESFEGKVVVRSQAVARRPNTGFKLRVQQSNKGQISNLFQRRNSHQTLSSQRSLHDGMNEEERQNLQKFWITGPCYANVQEKDATIEQTQDNSQNWHLRNITRPQNDYDFTNFQLQSMNEAQVEVKDQNYKEDVKDGHALGAIIQRKAEKPWVQLSNNEQLYLQINQRMKGPKISSQYHKQLTRLTQQQCFNNQKSDIIQLMMSKKNVCGHQQQQVQLKKKKRKNYNQDSSAISSTETKTEDDEEQTIRDEEKEQNESELEKSTSMYNLQFQEKDIPIDASSRQAYILKQVELDNYRDIEDPFVCLTTDKRVNKVEIKPKVAVPTDDHRKTRLNFQDADFWYLKGYDHGMHFEMDSAIDSYRQAIRLETRHADAMINLGGQYELQQRYDLATKWYKIAMIVDPEKLDAYYGYALCKFKDGDCQQAIDHLSIAIEKLDNRDVKKRSGMHLVYFRYLRSMCYRVSQDFRRSQKDYKDILRAFEIQEGSKYAKNIIAMILMPMETNRKKLLQYVEQFRSILDLFDADQDRRELSQYYLAHIKDQFIGDNQNPKWHDKRLPEVIRTLQKRPFFCRLKLKRIVEIVQKMDLHLLQKKELLFFKPDKVYVIVSGNVIMKNHEQNILLPQTCAKFCEGDVLNYLQDESKLFNSLETWFFAQVQTEVAVFDREYFEQIWFEDIMSEDVQLNKSLIVTQPIFKHLSEQTLLTLVSDVFKVRKFKKGDLIALQSKYSPTNMQFRQYYEVKLSKFAEELKLKRTINDITKERTKRQTRKKQQPSPSKNKKRASEMEDGNHRQHEASAGTIGTLTSDPSSPSKMVRAKDLEDLNKATATAQMFNFESLRKQRLEHKLGIGDEGSILMDSEMGSPDYRKSDNRILQLVSTTMSETRTMKQLSALRKKEQMKKEDELAARLKFSKNSRCQGGFYLIKQGHCVVQNHDDRYRAKILKHGDFFGESDLLQCVGYSFFGEIIADTDDVECWFIPEERFVRIPQYEQAKMKEYAEKRRDVVMLSFEYSKKYKIEMSEYQNYFGN